MKTLSRALRWSFHLVVVCASAFFVRCEEEDVKAHKIQVITELSFEVTGWITDELCYWDCLGRYPDSSGEVDEANASGIVVPIFFSSPAGGDGNFHISWSDPLYGIAFTTIPAPTPEGFIDFPVTKGDMMRSFTILPVDNDENANGFYTQFYIASVTGALKEGTSTMYQLTFKDDDN